MIDIKIVDYCIIFDMQITKTLLLSKIKIFRKQYAKLCSPDILCLSGGSESVQVFFIVCLELYLLEIQL
jgi:hypothetical protein